MSENTIIEACSIMKQLIENKKAHLSATSIELSDVRARAPDKLSADDESRTNEVALLAMKTKLAISLAELQVADETENKGLPDDEAVIQTAADVWITETLANLDTEKDNLRKKLKTLESHEQQLSLALEVNKLILESVISKHQDAVRNINEIHLEAIRKKENLMEEARRRSRFLRKEMQDFVSETFPQIPGCVSMYTFLRELTTRDRGEYFNVPGNMWPPYLAALENNGIVKRNPANKDQVSIIDFSDGEHRS